MQNNAVLHGSRNYILGILFLCLFVSCRNVLIYVPKMGSSVGKIMASVFSDFHGWLPSESSIHPWGELCWSRLGLEVNSPAMITSTIHLFPKLTSELQGRHLESDYNVIDADEAFLNHRVDKFDRDGINELNGWLNKLHSRMVMLEQKGI